MSVRLLADGVAPSRCRLVTYEFTLPMQRLKDFNTHRMLSKNAASTRAKPVAAVVEQVLSDPCLPSEWQRNEPGMQGHDLLTEREALIAEGLWLEARDRAVETVLKLAGKGWWYNFDRGGWADYDEAGPFGDDAVAFSVHKQILNRLLEPWMRAEVVATGTDWQNFFALRCHKATAPELREVARDMHDLYWSHRPAAVPEGRWQLPYVGADEAEALGVSRALAVSVARCARVSVRTFDGAIDYVRDQERTERLLHPDPDDPEAPLHSSPFEHQGLSLPEQVVVAWGGEYIPGSTFHHGNFRGWKQYRKLLARECAPEPLWDYHRPGEILTPPFQDPSP